MGTPQKMHRRLRRGRGWSPEFPFIKWEAAGREAREPTAGGE